MCQRSTLETLAEQICSSSKILSAYCLTIDHPQPSFDVEAPSITIPATAPPNVLSARQNILDASWRIRQLVIEPAQFLEYQAINYQIFASVNWLCHFGILSMIPLHGSVTYSEVAVVAGVPLKQLKRIARTAMTGNFLAEPIPGHVAHNATSGMFVTNPSINSSALFMAQTSCPGALAMAKTTEKYGPTEKNTETAFDVARNGGLHSASSFNPSPDQKQNCVAYIKSNPADEGLKIEHLINGFDWESLSEASVVNIGDSHCRVAIALATTFPLLKIIIQDSLKTIANSPDDLADVPYPICSRITFQPQNLFQPRPVENATVFLIRMIAHEWSDADATAILKSILPALKVPGSRLIIMETVLPIPGLIPASEEALLRARDLTMLQAFNGRERELSEWERLLTQASMAVEDGGGKWAFKNVTKPLGSVMSLLEIVWQMN